MQGSYVTAIDVHSYRCHALTLTPTGRPRCEQSLATSIPALRQFITASPRPRAVVFEEGPLAGWLYRNLRHDAERIVVAETRRNAYVARDGDKSDAIDAAKLAQLYRSGMIRPVHHSDDEKRDQFKRLVLMDRATVEHRVAHANMLIGQVRGHGVVIRERHFQDPSKRDLWRASLPASKMVSLMTQTLLERYDQAFEHEVRIRSEMIRRAKRIPMVRRFTALPGVGWVRAATFYALIDTPFRFGSKAKLWRYMGIGLQRRSSGNGREQVRNSPACNHHLKDIILGAARAAVRCKDGNPFIGIYQQAIGQGKSKSVAYRMVARTLASTMWGMWKSDSDYHPHWVAAPRSAANPRRVTDEPAGEQASVKANQRLAIGAGQT